LDSIKIEGPGLQQQLLRIHKELRSNIKGVSSPTVEEMVSPKEFRDVKRQVAKLSSLLSSETDSDVVVGSGNQKMISKSKQSLDKQSGNNASTASQSNNIQLRLAHVELAVQDLSQHANLQAEQGTVRVVEGIRRKDKDPSSRGCACCIS
jgi:hypothetical protein